MTCTSTNPAPDANPPHPVVHGLAFAGGAVIIAAAAHAVCVATAAYGTAHAALIWSAAFAIVAGGVAVANASGRWAVAIVAALICGELYALNLTAERAITEREIKQAPIRAALDAHSEATTRFEAAIAAKAALAEKAIAAIKEKDCRDRCKTLLTEQKAEAAAEELRARADLARHPKPLVSASPLADRFGVDPAKWDIGVAALAGLGLNGLGAVLVAFAAHGWFGSARAQRKAVSALPDISDDDLAATRAFFTDPPTPPRGPRKRKTATQPSNVIAFRNPVVQALESAGGTVASNQDLARLMGVTEGEATKRVRECRHLLDLRREGKRLVISLKAQRVA